MRESVGEPNGTVASKAPVTEETDALCADRRVRVHRGPLRGAEGTVLHWADSDRLLVAFDGSQGVYLEIDRSLLEPL